MANLTEGVIRKSNDKDIVEIVRWLREQEGSRVVETLACNSRLTQSEHDDGTLLVYVDSVTKKAVAYQWGALLQPGILEVKADYRGQGIGKKLAEFCLNQARKNGDYVLRIQCEPKSSIPFWQKMGFQLNGDPQNNAYMFLTQSDGLPTGCSSVPVRFELFKEEKNWKPTIDPLEVVAVKGALLPGGNLVLSERVFLLSNGERTSMDAVLRVVIDDKEVYLDKAKYLDKRCDPDTKIQGAVWTNQTFVIDQLKFEEDL